MKVIVVESPAKAKTLSSYLGKDFNVLASFGHIRDLPSKDGSVNPDKDFSMTWALSDRAAKIIANISKALKNADILYLATDPDREGEAISWHIEEILKEKKALTGKQVKRIVFHEITKQAVLDAIHQPRAIDQDLVDAYLARRALDYLMGFTLSPILWRKLPGSRSAGRVQSVALRLITEREEAIETFISQEYWSIHGQFEASQKDSFDATLTHLDSKKLEKFSLPSKEDSQSAVQKVKSGIPYVVSSLEKKKVQRHPSAPFTTSTLQQEASRKLGFSASRTMRLAQTLYEGIDLGGETVGLITYMRTDSVVLSKEALSYTRSFLLTQYGDKYLPSSPRTYKTKTRNAQEAHEAIRPTDINRTPEKLKNILIPDAWKLYDLIWKRTIASQMESALYDQSVAVLTSRDTKVHLRASGSTLIFDGFLKVYEESIDDDPKDSKASKLPPLQEDDKLTLLDVKANQHFTEPLPRYTEASLVKKLEELGIGRPSTYASIIQVLQDRQYVRLETKRFFPEERGRLVTTFLETYFPKYVTYDFTADLENDLDAISEGKEAWKKILKDFWSHLKNDSEETQKLRLTDVLTTLDEKLSFHLFPPSTDSSINPRQCPSCQTGRLSLKIGKFGAFIGCSAYPECSYTRPIVVPDSEKNTNEEEDSSSFSSNEFPKILGKNPTTQQDVSLRKGPYGLYLQEDIPPSSAKKKKEEKPKRSALPRGISPATLSLEKALQLLSLPRLIGTDPETGNEIYAGIGRFGPYIQCAKVFVSLKDPEDLFLLGINRAISLIQEKIKNPSKRSFMPKKASPKSKKKESSSVKAKSPKKKTKKSS